MIIYLVYFAKIINYFKLNLTVNFLFVLQVNLPIPVRPSVSKNLAVLVNSCSSEIAVSVCSVYFVLFKNFFKNNLLFVNK